MGLCPNCHSSLIMKGEPHWNGIQYPFECPVCGVGGDLVRGDKGALRFVIAPDGMEYDRNVNECRDKHLDEIIATKIDFFQRQESVKDEFRRYTELTFPAI